MAEQDRWFSTRRGVMGSATRTCSTRLGNPVRSFLVGDDMTTVIGADRAGRLIEVGVVEGLADSELVIAHAMPARGKFLRR